MSTSWAAKAAWVFGFRMIPSVAALSHSLSWALEISGNTSGRRFMPASSAPTPWSGSMEISPWAPRTVSHSGANTSSLGSCSGSAFTAAWSQAS